MRFGIRRTLTIALVLGTGVSVWALMADIASGLRWALVIACLSLPSGALSHYAVEALTSVGRPVRALALFRIVVPAMALALIWLTALVRGSPGAAGAIAAWGIGWMVALFAMVTATVRALPSGVIFANPEGNRAIWKRETRPFFVYRFCRSLSAQMPLLMLELLGGSSRDIGAYAAAAATGGMVTVLATATNRVYGREMALRIRRRDARALRHLFVERARWLLPVIVGLSAGIIVMAEPVLTLFRPSFAQTGALPLRILTIGSAATVFLSLAPTMLKFSGQNVLLYKLLALGAVAQLLLHLILIPHLGATGAAIAQSSSMLLLYSASAVLAMRKNSYPASASGPKSNMFS